MIAYRMFVFSNPSEGLEEEYNDWYNNQHLSDVVQVDGIVAAQRFAVDSSPGDSTPPPFRYLAIYELETDDVGKVLDELRIRAGTPQMPRSPALGQVSIAIAKAITPVVSKSK